MWHLLMDHKSCALALSVLCSAFFCFGQPNRVKLIYFNYVTYNGLLNYLCFPTSIFLPFYIQNLNLFNCHKVVHGQCIKHQKRAITFYRKMTLFSPPHPILPFLFWAQSNFLNRWTNSTWNHSISPKHKHNFFVTVNIHKGLT